MFFSASLFRHLWIPFWAQNGAKNRPRNLGQVGFMLLRLPIFSPETLLGSLGLYFWWIWGQIVKGIVFPYNLAGCHWTVFTTMNQVSKLKGESKAHSASPKPLSDAVIERRSDRAIEQPSDWPSDPATQQSAVGASELTKLELQQYI